MAKNSFAHPLTGDENMSPQQPSAERNDGDRPFTGGLADRMYRLPPYLCGKSNPILYHKRRAGDDMALQHGGEQLLRLDGRVGAGAQLSCQVSEPRKHAVT